jgi:photosystem II stability/assembly factor-like uncharacterized protein
MYAAEPSISFIDNNTGLISGESAEGASWVRRTNDTGRHWATVSDHFIQNMQLVSENVAVGAEFVDARADRFAKTTDGGHSWTLSDLPGLKFVSKISFRNPEVGWIAGTDGSNDLNARAAVVLWTADSGQHWATSPIPSRAGVADIRDMFFLNESFGWLITWGYNNDGTHLYLTTDGGKTWRVHPDQTIQGPGKWLSVVRFIDTKIGFAFEDATDAPKALQRILYTNDGGKYWRPYPLDAHVNDCQASGRGLRCSASRGKSSFLMLQIEPTAERR